MRKFIIRNFGDEDDETWLTDVVLGQLKKEGFIVCHIMQKKHRIMLRLVMKKIKFFIQTVISSCTMDMCIFVRIMHEIVKCICKEEDRMKE